MAEVDSLFEKIIKTALNHNARVQEGRNLLEAGKSLADMSTPPIGLTLGEIKIWRQKYLNNLGEMDDDKLKWVYGNVVYQLLRLQDNPDGGGSESEWRRLAIEDELRKRKIQIHR